MFFVDFFVFFAVDGDHDHGDVYRDDAAGDDGGDISQIIVAPAPVHYIMFNCSTLISRASQHPIALYTLVIPHCVFAG